MKEKPLLNILLVEDDDIDAEAFQRGLAKYKAKYGREIPLWRAYDGQQALDMLLGKNGESALPRPHIIFLDLNMPRMNGFEFLNQLRKNPLLNGVIVFVLTTSSIDEDKTSAYEGYIAGYLLKDKMGSNFNVLMDLLNFYVDHVELFPNI